LRPCLARVQRTAAARPHSETSSERIAAMAESAAAELVFDHVTKRYPGQERPAVDDLSLTIPAGDLCVLVGPSGGCKTTAMKMVNRLITITEGDILIDGRG